MNRKDSSPTNALSITALTVGSLSSAATAVVVHEFWQAGAILGAAVTPVLVAIFNELLRRPVDRIHVRTSTQLGGPRPVRVAAATGSGAQVRVYRARSRWGTALVTAAAAFVIGITALTVSELLLDRSVGDERERTTLFGSGRTPTPSRTAPAPPTETTDDRARESSAARRRSAKQPEDEGRTRDAAVTDEFRRSRPNANSRDRQTSVPEEPATATTPQPTVTAAPSLPSDEEVMTPSEPAPPTAP